MNALNPLLLFGLPLVLLPVLIHLLNRMRFRSVRWAAVMFLLAATRSSVRRAKLRQYLLLACRVLILLFLVLAMSRPVVGGRLGSALAGAPDYLLVLFDRSASMSATDPAVMVSKRERALALLEAGAKTVRAGRTVLIDSVSAEPQELASLQGLSALARTGPSETGADIPLLFQSAVDYLLDNPPGRAEIWVVSDLQRSSWNPEAPRWEALDATLAALPQKPRVRVLAFPEAYGHNVSIALREVARVGQGDRARVELVLELTRDRLAPKTLPLLVTLNGTRRETEIRFDGERQSVQQTVAIDASAPGAGWGSARVPADANDADNACYFVFPTRLDLRALVVSGEPEVARCLRLAAAPVPEDPDRAVAVEPPGEASAASWQGLSAVLWQAGEPSPAVARLLDTHLEEGGVVLCLPPPAADRSPFGLAWRPVEQAPVSQPFQVPVWAERDGLLRNTLDGAALPVDRIGIRRRRLPESGLDQGWAPVASYADGAPFLLRRRAGRGWIYALTTLPAVDWSDLREGAVLVPLVQRALHLGQDGRRQIEQAACGAWRPADEALPCLGLDAEGEKDYRARASVYRSGEQYAALNMPEAEADPAILEAQEVPGLLADLRVDVLDRLGDAGPGDALGELTNLFFLLSLAAVLGETGLLLAGLKRRGEREEVAS